LKAEAEKINILNYLCQIDAFLLDVGLLKGQSSNHFGAALPIQKEDFLKAERLTYGLLNESLNPGILHV
jgi:hypothetical protein